MKEKEFLQLLRERGVENPEAVMRKIASDQKINTQDGFAQDSLIKLAEEAGAQDAEYYAETLQLD